MKEEKASEDWPRGVELRVIGGGAPSGWEPVEDEEVVRLEKSGVAGVRSVEEVEPYQASEAGRRHRRRGWSHHSLTLLMAGLVAVLVVGAAAALILTREDDPGRQAPFEGVSVVHAAGEDPDDPFLKTTARYLGEAREQLTRLVEVRDAAGAAGMVRHGAELRPLLERHWTPPALDQAGIATLSIELEGDGTGREWAALSGKDRDGRTVRFVFVPEEGGLVFDWAASVGANKTGLEAFRRSKEGDTGDFRVEVMVDHYYDSSFPEEVFRCFKVTDVFGGSSAWAYARRGSAAAAAVVAELHAEGTILEEPDKGRLMLRLGNRGAGGRGQFELIEVLASDWIRGEAK